MASPQNQSRSRIIPALLVGGASYVALDYTGPLMRYGDINLLTALAWLALGLAGIAFAIDMLTIVANLCKREIAKTPTGVKGKARLIKRFREIRHELASKNQPALWLGVFQGKSVRATIEACACIVGPSGSGKSTKSFIPSILSILGENIAYFDFKSDVTPQLARYIRSLGIKLVPINMGGLYTDIVGKTAYYNPLVIIVELLWQKGGLEEILDTVRELCQRLEPDREAENADSFWKDSTRRWGGIVIQFVVLLLGDKATLGDVLHMLNDRKALLQNARFFAGRLEVAEDASGTEFANPMFSGMPWVKAGIHDPVDIENYADHLRGLASSMCDLLEAPDSRMADSILSGSQIMLEGFERPTRAHKITSKTTFRFSELKDEAASQQSKLAAIVLWVLRVFGLAKQSIIVSFMCNPDMIKAHSKVFSILTYCMFWELKKHPNKHKKVWVLIDEATNLPLVKVDEMMTWLRSYSVILVFWFQNFARWEKAFGKTALEVLLSESEIMLIMPGTRNPKTLDLVSKMANQTSVVVPHYRNNPQLGAFGTELSDYREESEPALDTHTLGITKLAHARIRNNPWMPLDSYSVAEMHPWRTDVDGSPMYSFKPYLKPIKHYVSGRMTRLAGLASGILNAACVAVIGFVVFMFNGGTLS